MSRAAGAIPAALLTLALGLRPAAAEQPVAAVVADSPVVLELFTSEGCNSCPPADALLGRLAGRSELLPLAFHVDYWDYLGWKDPFSSKAATERQYGYSRALGDMIYTPQLVVDGVRDAIGSDEAAVDLAIEAEKAQPKLRLAVRRGAGGELKVSIPAGDARSSPASVYLALFDHAHETSVGRGENSGRTLTEFNIVREWRKVGEWRGTASEAELGIGPQPTPFDFGAVILQEGASGRILGATAFALHRAAGL